MGNSGKIFGIFALIIAIVALGLGAYQIILPSPSEGPKIYVTSNDDMVFLDFSTLKYIPQLNITYSTKAGDSVLLEYSCQIRLDIKGSSNTIWIYFDINGTTPSSYIYLRGVATDTHNIYSSGIMRYYIQSSTAGEHNVQIYTWINEDYTNSYVRFSVLTVTVY